jgi:hypothetical protein
MDKDIDSRLTHALHVAKEWENERIKTGEAMKASSGAHAVARESSDLVLTSIARSIGHAVATAHMADHSPGAALYALKALKLAGKPTGQERAWQHAQLLQLPQHIVEIVLIALQEKEKALKIS